MNQLPSVTRYVMFQGGCQEELPETRFILHDDTQSFESNPRVFTTFSVDPAKEDLHYTIRFLPAHIARLMSDAAGIGILSDIKEHHSDYLQRCLLSFLESNLSCGKTPVSYRVRVLLSRKGAEFFLDSLPSCSSLFRLVSHSGTRELPILKSTLTSMSRLARAKAERLGYDEALLIEPETNVVLEGAWSNFFWFDSESTLFTSAGSVLPGITRAAISAIHDVRQVHQSIHEVLLTATEAFITQSTRGIIPVSHIDEAEIGSMQPGPLVQKLISDFVFYSKEHSTMLLAKRSST